MEVMIDGVRYVPAREVIVNRAELLRAIVDLWWARPEEGAAWYEEISKEVYVIITDVYDGDPDTMTAADFLDYLASRDDEPL